MIEKVLQLIKEHHMIEADDHILVGVSGGADSVCLLFVLCQLQAKLNFELRIIHVEHGIRGEESISDCHFVEELCKEKKLRCKSIAVDVPTYAKERKLSLEEAARKLRYDIFKAESKAWGDAKIAIAHNQNDDAETLLFHLIRGSGLQGLCGILPVRGKIIRPLLNCSREEIIAFLNQEGQVYCTDSTNNDIVYSRNRIRSEILPELEQINRQTISHIQQASDIICQTAAYIEKQTEAAASSCIEQREEGVLIRQEFFQPLDGLIKKEILKAAIWKLSESRKDIERLHLEALEELFCKQVGKQSTLPYQIKAKRVYEGVLLFRPKEELKREEIRISKEELEASGSFAITKGNFMFQILENPDFFEKNSLKTYTKWFDYDKIRSDLLARNRREGDYFVCNEQGNTQRLNRFFINEKVDSAKRDDIWLLAEESHILWTVGHRISTYYKVRKDTKRVLEVRFIGGSEND